MVYHSCRPQLAPGKPIWESMPHLHYIICGIPSLVPGVHIFGTAPPTHGSAMWFARPGRSALPITWAIEHWLHVYLTENTAAPLNASLLYSSRASALEAVQQYEAALIIILP